MPPPPNMIANRFRVVHKILKQLYIELLKDYNTEILYKTKFINFIELISPKINDIICKFIYKNTENINRLYSDFLIKDVPKILETRFRKDLKRMIINLFSYYKHRNIRISKERLWYNRDKKKEI